MNPIVMKSSTMRATVMRLAMFRLRPYWRQQHPLLRVLADVILEAVEDFLEEGAHVLFVRCGAFRLYGVVPTEREAIVVEAACDTYDDGHACAQGHLGDPGGYYRIVPEELDLYSALLKVAVGHHAE